MIPFFRWAHLLLSMPLRKCLPLTSELDYQIISTSTYLKYFLILKSMQSHMLLKVAKFLNNASFFKNWVQLNLDIMYNKTGKTFYSKAAIFEKFQSWSLENFRVRHFEKHFNPKLLCTYSGLPIIHACSFKGIQE